MPSSSYVEYALELLSGLGPVQARAMMGGHMVQCGGLSVALVYEERLYLKTDEETRETFRAAGGEPFTYDLRGRLVEMSYWTPPDAALDGPEAMQPWAELAIGAARRKRKAPTARRKAAPRAAPRRRSSGPRRRR